MNYVFIISLPRSGSTWLQRELVSKCKCVSYPETWMFLPLVYNYKISNAATGYSVYSEEISSLAIDEFKNKFCSNEKLNKSIRSFFDCLFSDGDDESIIIEKTPRNALILNELIEIFPDSKFILLFRDPVDISVSMMNAWGGTWNTYFRYEVDFKVGLKNMIDVSKRNLDNVYLMNYSDLSDEKNIDKIVSFIGAEKEERFSRDRVHKIQGVMGDKKFYKGERAGNEAYGLSFIKKMQIIRIIKAMEPELKCIGYDGKDLVRKVRLWKVGGGVFKDLISELVRYLYKELHMVKFLKRLMRKDLRGKGESIGVE